MRRGVNGGEKGGLTELHGGGNAPPNHNSGHLRLQLLLDDTIEHEKIKTGEFLGLIKTGEFDFGVSRNYVFGILSGLPGVGFFFFFISFLSIMAYGSLHNLSRLSYNF